MGEITALKHKIRDHTVERGAFVAKAVLASRELSKVSCGFRDDLVIEFENNSTSRVATDSDVKLKGGKKRKHEQAMHAKRVGVQERTYVDVGHGCLEV